MKLGMLYSLCQNQDPDSSCEGEVKLPELHLRKKAILFYNQAEGKTRMSKTPLHKPQMEKMWLISHVCGKGYS